MEDKLHPLPQIGPDNARELILNELCAMAFSDYTDYVRVEDGRAVLRESRELDAPRRAAIASIKEGTKGVELKLHDKQRALELLAKLFGVFDEAGEQSVRVVLDGVPEEWTN